MTPDIPSLIAELRRQAQGDIAYANDLTRRIAADTLEVQEVRSGAAARLAMADDIEAAMADHTPADPELAAEG